MTADLLCWLHRHNLQQRPLCALCGEQCPGHQDFQGQPWFTLFNQECNSSTLLVLCSSPCLSMYITNHCHWKLLRPSFQYSCCKFSATETCALLRLLLFNVAHCCWGDRKHFFPSREISTSLFFPDTGHKCSVNISSLCEPWLGTLPSLALDLQGPTMGREVAEPGVFPRENGYEMLTSKPK